MNQQQLQWAIGAVVIAVVMTLRLRSMRRTRPLKLTTLWVVPAILAGIAVVTLVSHPPGALGYALSAVALVVAGLIGWQRGRLMHIAVDPVLGTLTQTASPAAMLLLVGLIAVRFVARSYFAAGAAGEQALVVTDVALMFAVGLIGVTRIEMLVRGRRILTGIAEAPQ